MGTLCFVSSTAKFVESLPSLRSETKEKSIFVFTLQAQNSTMERAKRQREEPPVAVDFMLKARIIMEDDPFKDRAPSGKNRAFCALFGCSPEVAYKLWQNILSFKLLPQGGSITHLLWTLILLKNYPTEDAIRRLTCGADQKTICKWTRQFVTAVAGLEPFLVSLIAFLLLHTCIRNSHILFACRFIGRIERKGTLEMIVLFLLMVLIFVSLMPVENSIATSTRNLDYAMKLRFVF